MDFNFPENRYSTMSSFPPPQESSSFNTNRRGGSIMVKDYYYMTADYTGDSSLSNLRYMVKRENEEERIREEIMMAEMVRKQAVEKEEEEIRRKMVVERELLSSVPAIRMIHYYHHPYKYVNAMPFQRHPTPINMMPEVKSVPQPPKGMLLVLPKPKDSDLAMKKMVMGKKPTTPLVVPEFPSKAKKQELSCAVCQVIATSEQALSEHIRGKKHQAKVAKMKATKPATSSKWKKKKKNQKKNGKKKTNFQFDSSNAAIVNKQIRLNRFQRGKN